MIFPGGKPSLMIGANWVSDGGVGRVGSGEGEPRGWKNLKEKAIKI